MKKKNKIENSLERLFSAKKSDLEKPDETPLETSMPAPEQSAKVPDAVKPEPKQQPAPKSKTAKKTTTENKPPKEEKQPAPPAEQKKPTEKAEKLAQPEVTPAPVKEAPAPVAQKKEETALPPAKTQVDETFTKAIVAKKEEDSYDTDEHLVIFSLADQSYGVSIMIVESIIKMQAITNVPRAHPSIEGATNLRGVVLPVINLCKKLGLPLTENTEDERIVVVAVQDITAGFVVDNVQSVLRIPAAEIAPPSPMVTSISTKYIKGIAKNGEQGLIIILDPVKIFESIIMETSDRNQIHLIK